MASPLSAEAASLMIAAGGPHPIYAGASSLAARRGKWNPCCTCNFSALPDALVEREILALLQPRDLAKVAQVSTRFSYLAESPSLWKSLELETSTTSTTSNNTSTCAITGGIAATPSSSGIGMRRLLQRKQHTIESLLVRGDGAWANNGELFYLVQHTMM